MVQEYPKNLLNLGYAEIAFFSSKRKALKEAKKYRSWGYSSRIVGRAFANKDGSLSDKGNWYISNIEPIDEGWEAEKRAQRRKRGW